MKVHVGVEKPQLANSFQSGDFVFGLEDLVDHEAVSHLVARDLGAQVLKGRHDSSTDRDRRVDMIADIFSPQPDNFRLIAYQTKVKYLLSALRIVGVSEEMLPLTVEVPKELENSVRNLQVSQ